MANALFAVALGAEMGLNRAAIEHGLLAAPRPKCDCNCAIPAGIRVLDDSYNANADSMLAALQTLRDLPCAGRRVAVLGDMAELGECSQSRACRSGTAGGGIRGWTNYSPWANGPARSPAAARRQRIEERGRDSGSGTRRRRR